MGFNSLLLTKATSREFENQRLLISYKERPHVSKSTIDKSGCIYVNINSLEQFHYDPLGPKYVAFINLTYDFAISLYNFDKRSGIVYRVNNNKENEPLFFKYLNMIKKFKRDNFEGRIFGFQNGPIERHAWKEIVAVLYDNLDLNEVDLFGTETRNIAINIETGQSFNILMENRLYKPGELTTKITRDEFEASIKNSIKK